MPGNRHTKKGRDVDVRNGREMVAGLNRNWRLIDEENPHRMPGKRRKKRGKRRLSDGTMNEKSARLINEGKNREKMKVELIIPIEGLHGKLRRDGYYFRKYRGQQIVQKCPNREGHVKTEAEAANQRRFAEKYAGSHRQVNSPKPDPDAGLNPA